MFKLFDRRSKPHPRYKGVCAGVGTLPVGSGDEPDTHYCGVCGEFFKLRRHKSRAHGWERGTLVMHKGRPLAWWERFLWWRW